MYPTSLANQMNSQTPLAGGMARAVLPTIFCLMTGSIYLSTNYGNWNSIHSCIHQALRFHGLFRYRPMHSIRIVFNMRCHCWIKLLLFGVLFGGFIHQPYTNLCQ